MTAKQFMEELEKARARFEAAQRNDRDAAAAERAASDAIDAARLAVGDAMASGDADEITAKKRELEKARNRLTAAKTAREDAAALVRGTQRALAEMENRAQAILHTAARDVANQAAGALEALRTEWSAAAARLAEVARKALALERAAGPHINIYTPGLRTPEMVVVFGERVSRAFEKLSVPPLDTWPAIPAECLVHGDTVARGAPLPRFEQIEEARAFLNKLVREVEQIAARNASRPTKAG